MALDLYVGGFARYFARDWENAIQRHCRETGTPYQAVAPGGTPEPADRVGVRAAVANWTTALDRGLGEHLPAPLQWDESEDAPYFSARPGYEGYGALSLWAAYAEADLEPPDDFDDEWMENEVYQDALANTDPEATSLRVVHSTQIWLPADFRFSFDFEDLTGETVHISSSPGLIECLDALNERTFQLDPAAKSKALKGEFPDSVTPEDIAKYGFAVFDDLARKAWMHKLPMFFDC